MKLGERIRAAIDRKNKSHSWVAEEVGMTPATLSNILNGYTEDPSFFTVLAIARVLGEPLSALVDDPYVIWNREELDQLRATGEWLVARTTPGQSALQQLEIPPRKKARGRVSAVLPVAATSGGVLYPEAFELPRKRIPAAQAKLGVDAVFSVRGESMIGEQIEPGDLLYVKRTADVSSAIGSIIVCEIDDMVLVKRLKTNGRELLLVSAHDDHPTMTIDEETSRFRLIGIVLGTSPAS